MFPDATFITKNNEDISHLLDEGWRKETFIPSIQKWGAEIIAKRGLSSAASAAQAVLDHMYDWHYGTKDSWTSAGVFSNGEYGIQKGLFFSYPTKAKYWKFHIVPDLTLNEEQLERIKASEEELIKEREMVSSLL